MPKYARRDSDNVQAIEVRVLLPRNTLVRLMMTMHPRQIQPGLKQKPLTDRDVRGAIDYAMRWLTMSAPHPLLETLDGPDSAERDAALRLYAWIDAELVRLDVFGPQPDEWIDHQLATRGLTLPEEVAHTRLGEALS
ncbi:hypothetical protein ACFORH_43230 [Amycolatopsis roodepoortensis]|uniref:Uncharacterized protein n=1 Tax=Amycolatopsis roodepoortensis TaxID=700274 RepID=A0ABR9LIC8_9PSEU|nr:hypothetical protein [Amycolatopsis roodepoortensis]MBE1580444.1 hypothetical protein [Amycolatopsis roodepoortensis]